MNSWLISCQWHRHWMIKPGRSEQTGTTMAMYASDSATCAYRDRSSSYFLRPPNYTTPNTKHQASEVKHQTSDTKPQTSKPARQLIPATLNASNWSTCATTTTSTLLAQPATTKIRHRPNTRSAPRPRPRERSANLGTESESFSAQARNARSAPRSGTWRKPRRSSWLRSFEPRDTMLSLHWIWCLVISKWKAFEKATGFLQYRNLMQDVPLIPNGPRSG